MFIIASHLGEVCYIRTTNINESWLFLFLLRDDYNTGYFGPRFDYKYGCNIFGAIPNVFLRDIWNIQDTFRIGRIANPFFVTGVQSEQ